MININNDSLALTPKLKSSPISIDFISFNQNDINCIYCGNKYSETLLFKQKYCKECLLQYFNKITTDNYIYLDLHISTINSQCNEHKKRNFFTQEWCDNCSVISFFKQIPTNSLAIYDDDFSSEEQNIKINIIIENEKSCKFCGKLIYKTSLLYEKLKICSNCYPISYEFMAPSTTKETIPIFYLPWWDTFYVCLICKAELIFDINQKWCPYCFIIYSGCRYCLTTNIIFGYISQSHCKKCKRVMSITLNNNITISIGNDGIDDFIYNKRNIINNCDINMDYMKNIVKYEDNPLNAYNFLKEKIYLNFNPEATMEWIPYSRIKILSKIAEEESSIVYKGTWLDGGIRGTEYSYCNRKKNETITVKKYINSRDINTILLNELKLYYQCYNKSCHILRYYGITKNDKTNEYMLVMRYIDGGSLFNYLRKNFKNITWKGKLEILLQISNGLKTIHDVNLVHQNFHSKNILLVESYKSYQKWQFGQWLIGLSQPDNILSNKVYEMMPYIAPEIFKGTAFSKNSDVYSMGMVMWELTSSCKPFANIEYTTSLIDDIINGKRPEITEDTPECYANLMKSCWNYNSIERPSMGEICETISDWLIMEKNIERFSQAEEKRLELEKSNTESYYSKIDCNKSLKSLISGSSSFSMNLFNMKLEHSLRELEKNDIQSSSSENVTNTLILAKNPSGKHNIEDEIQNNEKRIKT